MIGIYKKYMADVLSGKEIACELVNLAVKRQSADLKKKNYPYYFSAQEAERVLKFAASCRHTKGRLGGRPFNLQPNQCFLLAVLFGWRRKDTHARRFTQAYWEMARKAGKSELAAVIELYCCFFEMEEGAEVYTAATTRDQAGMVFRAAKKMAAYLRQDSPFFRKNIDVRANSVHYKPTDSFIQKVSADAGTLDGLSPHCAVIDEYHAHKTDDVKAVMQTGQGERGNPLLLTITTAGFDKDGPCFRVERRNAVDVLKGAKSQENLFPVIFTLDDGDDWKDPKVWRKANPNLGSTPNEEYLKQQVQDAINKGSSTIVQVCTKNFNIWMDAPEVWIPDEQILKAQRVVDLSEFEGHTVYLGLDLAAKKDITALTVFLPGNEERKPVFKNWYFLPEETVKARSDAAPYPDWVEGGYIITTPGSKVDYNVIRDQIYAIQDICTIASVNLDEWNAWETMTLLEERGLETQTVKPYYSYFSPPAKWLEAELAAGNMEIDQNPVTNWMFRNVVNDRDSQDNIKPNKKRSSEKIDGVVSIILATYGYIVEFGEPDSYSEDLILIL